jgi:hypothetical protein
LTNPNNFTESLKISQVADIFHEKMPFGGIKGSERKRKRGPVFFYASIDLHVRLHKWRPSAEFLKLLKIIKKILFVLV